MRRRAPAVRVQEWVPMAPFGVTLNIEIRRSSARRTLALRVTDPGEVVVNAPLGMRLGLIEQFVQHHGEWLRAHRQRASEVAFSWHEGMSLPWLGEALVLTRNLPLPASPTGVGEGQNHRLAPAPRSGEGRGGEGLKPAGTGVSIEAGQLVCAVPPERLEAAVLAWYRREARRLLGERLSAQCARLARPVPPLRLSNARTRWGSLSAQGVVSLNWRLVKASLAEIDYVICHELAHQCQRNHSPAFWREVAHLCPDYEAARQCLRVHGRHYFQF